MERTLNSYIDHTLLKPEANADEIRKLCEEALQHQFAAVCVLPIWANLACRLIKNGPCKLCSVVGFPLGANSSHIKAEETRELVQAGVEEVDMVIHVGMLKSGQHAIVGRDIEAVVKAADAAMVKVIIEACLLTDDEKRLAARLSVEAGARFVKTSTGFSKGGATVHDVALLREAVGPAIGVKASGGIRDLKTAMAMIDAGANRIGTSSGVSLIEATIGS